MIVTQRQPDEMDIKILHYLRAGLTYKEIATRIYLSADCIKYRVSLMKKHYKCPTIACLIHKSQDLA